MTENLSEPLIEKHEYWDSPTKSAQRWSRYHSLSVVLHILALCLLPAVYLVGYHEGAKGLPKLPTYSVSKDGYKLQLRQLDDDFHVQDNENKKYKGLPRPELDDAWESLIRHMNIRVHSDEARASNFTSIELNDGSGDVAALPTVFHSLHCLKTIRRTLFPESYPKDWELFKPPFPGGISEHMDHCIENIRQSIMCQGDVSLYSYKWLPAQDMPKPLAHMEHVCVDWGKLENWVSERSFSIFDGVLTNPYRGTWQPHERDSSVPG